MKITYVNTINKCNLNIVLLSGFLRDIIFSSKDKQQYNILFIILVPILLKAKHIDYVLLLLFLLLAFKCLYYVRVCLSISRVKTVLLNQTNTKERIYVRYVACKRTFS